MADDAQKPKSRLTWRNATAWALGLGVSALILAGLLYFVDVAQVTGALEQADLRWLAAATGFFSAATLCRWWRVVLLTPKGSRRALLGVSSGHALLNKILPLRTGELTFPLLYRRATGASLRGGAVVLAAIRVSELACLLPLYAAALALYATTLPVVAVAVAALAGVSLQLALPLGLRYLGKLKVLRQAREEFDALSRPRLLGLAAINTLVWLCLFGLYYTSLKAFGLDVTPAQSVVGAGGAIVTNLLPINGIGSVGTMEAGWTAGLAATGAAAGPVLTAGLAMHAITMVGNVPFALLGAGPLMKAPVDRGTFEP